MKRHYEVNTIKAGVQYPKLQNPANKPSTRVQFLKIWDHVKTRTRTALQRFKMVTW